MSNPPEIKLKNRHMRERGVRKNDVKIMQKESSRKGKLSDPYLSFAAGMNGLAGPLHGLANQVSFELF